MAITANTFTIESLPDEGSLFYKSLQSEDVSGAEEILAAVSGSTHYLTHLKIHADAAIDVSVGSGEDSNAVVTVHFGPIPLAAANGDFVWDAPPGKGLKCTLSAAIVIDAGAGTIWIEAHGKTCKGLA